MSQYKVKAPQNGVSKQAEEANRLYDSHMLLLRFFFFAHVFSWPNRLRLKINLTEPFHCLLYVKVYISFLKVRFLCKQFAKGIRYESH